MYATTGLPNDREGVAASFARRPHVRTWRYGMGLVACASLFSASNTWAQIAPRALTGVVKDSMGRVLENAVLSLDLAGEQRATRADQRGQFRFDNVSVGTHTLRTTWIGYKPDDRSIEMPGSGLELTIVLAKLPFQLDTLVVVAKRTGIFGTALDHTGFRPI